MSFKVQFASVTVGPKAFAALSFSGWPEMYDRKRCEAALKAFLAPTTLDDALEAFVALQRSRRSEFPERATTWGDVTNFLAKLKGVQPTTLEGMVSVGFWGFSLVRDAEKNEEGN